VAARSKARRRALDVLYEADLRRMGLLDVLREQVGRADPPVPEYAVTLVEGVAGRREQIDALISEYAVDWAIDRMPPVDRNILRLGVYELCWADDVPDGVVLAEAVALARDLSTDESPPFVNGLLGHIREMKPTLSL
jgi:transcription antitermination protein NusB